mmetsp:Transcript_72775/g.224787  ORF Transcript_72775/g.224787 Transcript_72775/m.224787 type:complete len:255 (-) Transcript_72775:131-895(-)
MADVEHRHQRRRTDAPTARDGVRSQNPRAHQSEPQHQARRRVERLVGEALEGPGDVQRHVQLLGLNEHPPVLGLPAQDARDVLRPGQPEEEGLQRAVQAAEEQQALGSDDSGHLQQGAGQVQEVLQHAAQDHRVEGVVLEGYEVHRRKPRLDVAQPRLGGRGLGASEALQRGVEAVDRVVGEPRQLSGQEAAPAANVHDPEGWLQRAAYPLVEVGDPRGVEEAGHHVRGVSSPQVDHRGHVGVLGPGDVLRHHH